jgi:gliding motility-associated-like protein
MGFILKKLRFLIFSQLILFPGLKVNAQIVNSSTLCNTNTYNFTSSVTRHGFWRVISGSGTFVDSTTHTNLIINNVGFGSNVYYFYEYNTFGGGYYHEHTLNITNYTPSAGRDTTLCYNITSFELDGTDPSVISKTGTWTVRSGSGTFANASSYNTTVSGFTVGTINTYRWTINGVGGGCGSPYDEISITIPAAPNAYAGADQNICPGASATLTATAGTGYSYLWSTAATTQSITVTPATSTNYKLTVTDSYGCKGTDDATINVSNIAAYNLTASATSYCSGTSGVTLTLSGSEIGVNYQLKIGAVNIGSALAGTGNTLTWNNVTVGTYTVLATNVLSSCTKTMNGSVTVTTNQIPTDYDLSESSTTYCSHTSGVSLYLNSSENGTNFQYQLYKNGTAYGSALSGTGSSLTWSNITAGTYTASAINTLTGCSNTMNNTVTISSITSPAVYNVTGTASYCAGTSGISVVLDGSESGKKYQLYKDGATDGALVTGTGAALTWTSKTTGTYTVVAQNSALTCPRTMNGSAVATEVALPVVFDLTAPAGYCADLSGVTITLSGSETGMDYTLKKDGTAISILSGTGSALTWSNMTAGTYTVTASTTGAKTCTVTMNGTPVITAYSLPAASAGADAAICQGGSLQISASGGNSYSWSPSAGLSNALLQNPVATPTATTVYTVTVTDANGCVASDQIQVTVNAKPSINLSAGSTTFCSGDSSLLTVTGANTYLWNTGATSASFYVKPAATTYYSVIGTNTYGCKDTADVTLTVNATPTVSAGADKTICKGSSVTLTASGADNYTWSNGASSASITVSPTVTVTYTVTGEYSLSGCKATDDVKVTANALPAATFTLNGGNTTIYCISDPMVALAGNPNAGGTFTSGTAGAVVGNYFDPAVAGAGLHTVTYTFTDANLCTNSNTSNISVIALPVVSISGLSSNYCSNSAPITITGTPFQDGNGHYGTWTFSGPSGALSDNGDGSADFDPTAIIASGNYTVTYTVANANGCYNSVSKSFTVNLAPTVSFVGLPSSICQSAAAATLTGNMAPSGTFTGLGITDNGNGTASYNPTGYIPNSYTITYTYQDPTSLCSSSYSKAVTVKLSPTVYSVTGGGNYCAGTAGLSVGLSNSASSINYELFLNGYTTSQTISGTGSAFSFGTKTSQGTYTVIATNTANSCTQTMAGSAVLVEDPLPSDAQSITGTTLVCPGTTQSYSVPAILNATSYQWTLPANAYITTGSGTNSISVYFAPNASTGNITVYGINSCGNGVSSTLAVTVSALPAAAGVISGKAMVCHGETNVIYSVAAIANATSYTWTIPSGATFVGGQGTSQIIVSYPSSASSGTITVLGSNPCGTGTSASLAITVVPSPQLTLNAPSGEITCAGTAVSVSATSTTTGATFSWQGINGGHIAAGANTANPSVDAAGDYVVTVTEPLNSCTISDTVAVLPDNAVPQNINITTTNAGILTCAISQVTLSATTSSTSFPVGYSWSTTGGTIVSGGGSASAIVSKAGVYVVKVTNLNNSCYTTKSITITEAKTYPDVTVVDPETEKITCSNTTATLTSSSTTSGVTYSWSGPGTILNSTTPNPVVSLPGTYSLDVTAPNGCVTTRTVWVQADSSVPAISISTPGVLTCTNATVTLNGTSTTSGATLLWTGPGIASGATTENPVINLPGSYTLTVTHPITGCTAPQSVTVTQDLSLPVISFPLVPAAITCSSTSTTLTSTVTPATSTLLWTGPGAISNNSINNPVVYAVGSYSLTATHPVSGCTASRTLTVADGRTPADVSIAVPAEITCTNGSVTIHGSTSITNYSAQWTTSNGTISGTSTNLNVVVTKAGTYTLTITNNTSGCTASSSVTVNADNAAPDITIDPNPDKLTCTQSKVTLYGASITSGITMQWTGPVGAVITDPTTATPTVDAIGNYILTVTAPNGCTSADTITVSEDKTVPPIPSIVTPDNLTCLVSTVNLEVSPLISNVDYLWTTTGSGTITNSTYPVCTVNAVGPYTVTVTNRSSGCTNQKSVVVSANNAVPSPAITGGPYVISCTSPSVVLNGSTSTGISPVWSASLGGHIVSNGNTLNPTVNGVGTYTLTTTDATTGCSASTSISVTSAGDLPTLTIDAYPANLTCSVTSVTLYGQPTEAGTTYTWTESPGHIVSGQTTFYPVVDQAGTYILTVTKTATGCVNTAAITVVQDTAAPSLAFSTPAVITCAVNQVQLKTSTTSGSVSYSWTTSGTGTINPGDENIANPWVLSAGTYSVTLTDLTNQCTHSGSVTVSADKTLPAVNVDKNPVEITCSITSVLLNGSSTTTGATYLWTTSGSGNIINPTTTTPRVDAAGTYVLTVTHPSTGCTASDNVTVSANTTAPNIWVDVTPALLTCTTTSVQLSGNSSTSGVTYLWTGPGTISDATIKQPYVDAPGIYTLTVTNPLTGCTSTATVTVSQDVSVPSAPVVNNDSVCFNSATAILSATGNNIKWYSNASLLVSAKIHDGSTYTPSTATAVGSYYYFVTQTDATSQCESPATMVTYKVEALPLLPVATDQSVCQGSANPALQATGSNIQWYNTSGGTLLGSGGYYTPPATVSAAGVYTYYATQTDANGCESAVAAATLTINAVPSKPVVNKLSAEICEGASNPLFTASGTNIKWYDNSLLLTPVATGNSFTSGETSAGTYPYYVTQTSLAGCTSSYETVLFYIHGNPQIYNVTGGGIYCEDQNGIIAGIDGSETGTTYSLILDGVSTVNTANGTGNAFDFGYQKTAGTYSIVATSSFGCQSVMSGSATVQSTPLPLAAGAISGSSVVCQATTGNVYTVAPITNATSYVWTVPPGAVISSGQGTNTIYVEYQAAATSGNVTVTGTNSCGNGSSSAMSVTVVATPQLSLGATPSVITCTTTSVTISAGSTTAGATFAWSPVNGGHIVSGEFNAIANVDAAGDYTVTVMEPVNSCKAQSTVTVLDDLSTPQNVTVTSTNSGILTCLAPVLTLSATTSSAFPVSYAWTATSGGNIVSGNNTNSINIDQPGVYTVVVTNLNNGCTTSQSITIQEQKIVPDIAVVDPAADKLTCSVTSIILSGSSVTAGVTYNWTGPGILANGTTNAPTVNAVGTYTFTVTAPNGCTSSKTVEVLSNYAVPTLTVNSNPDVLTCSKTTVSLQGSSTTTGALLQWAGPGIVSGASTQTPVVDKAGTYTLTAYEPVSFCTTSLQVVVSQDTVTPVISFPVIPAALTCNAPQTTLTGTTNVANPSYLWTTTNGTIVSGSATASAVVSKAGTYKFTVTNQNNGCSSNASETVTSNQASPNAQIAAASTITCTQPSVTITGSSTTVPVMVNWTTTDGTIASGASSFTPTVTKAGTYLMTVTNTSTGCTGTASVSISEDKTLPVISIDKSPSVLTCGFPTVQLNGTASGATLLWTGPSGAAITNATTSTPTGDKAGWYYLTATATNGCKSVDSTQVSSNFSLPQNVVISAPGILNCNNTTIQLTGSSSTSNALFAWSAISGGNILSSPINENIIVDAAGTYQLIVSHPVSLCTDTVTVAVTQDLTAPVITFPVVPATITCTQTTSTLSSSVTPVTTTLLWTGPGTISNATINNPVVNIAGTYTLTATNTATGCKTARTLTVSTDKTTPVISIAVPETITCSKTTVVVHATSSVADVTALWTTSNGSISGAANLLDVNVTKAGTYMLTLTSNSSGCTATKSVVVVSDVTAPDLTVNKNPAKITCSVTQVQLFSVSQTTGVSYSWTGTGTVVNPSSPTPTVNAAGSYILTLTAPNGCSIKDTVTVSQNKTVPSAPVILVPKVLTCSNTSVDLEISPVASNVDYLWTTTGSGNISGANSSIATVDAIGTYYVTATERTSGCTTTASVVVSEDKTLPSPVITGSPYSLTCSTGTLVLNGGSSSGISPVWTATQGGHIVSGSTTLYPKVDAQGYYTLTLTDSATGCKSSAGVSVGTSLDKPTLTVDAYPAQLTCSVTSVTLYGKPLQTGTTFTWTASPGNIVSGANTFNPVVNQPGTYILTVTDIGTGCTSTAAVEVTQNITAPLLVIDAPAQFTCTVKEVQLNAASTEGNVTYNWSTTGTGSIKAGYDNVASPVVLAPATYSVTITGIDNGCTTTGSVAVTENVTSPDITVDKNPSQLTCTAHEVVLSGSSLTTNAAYKWTTSGSGNIVNPLTTGPRVDAIGYYLLTVTNPANGCIAKDSVQVTRDVTVPDIWVNTKPDTLTCGVSTVKLSGNSSTTSVSYLWSGPGTISDATIKEPTVDAAGTYYLTVTSLTNGCTAVLPVVVVENKTAPVAPLVSDAYSCYGTATATLTATGTNVKWYSSATLTSSVLIHSGSSFTPSSATAVGTYYYFVTQTDPVNQCESGATTATFNVLSLPSAPVNIDNSVCEGLPNTALQASGSNIKWYDSPSGTLLASGNSYIPPSSVSVPGTYTYYASQTDASSCESSTTGVNLVIYANPSKPLVNNLVAQTCSGSSNPVFIASGNDVKWYASPSLPAPIKTGSSFTPLETTVGKYNYYVTQTNTHGCVSAYETVTFTIDSLPQKFVFTGGGVYCADQNGLTVGLSGSEVSSAYQLLLNGTTVLTSVNGTGAALNFGTFKQVGNYTVIATTSKNCSTTMTGGVTIAKTELPGAAPNISGQMTVCQNASGIVYQIDTISHATYYQWSVPSGVTVTAGLNSNKITVDFTSSAVSGVFNVYGVNACGSGTISSDFQVVVNHIPAAAGNIKYIGTNNSICLGDSTVIYEIDPVSYATDYEWVLPAGASIISGQNSNQIKVKFANNAATGTQYVKVRGVNLCGNGDWSALYTITVNPNPTSYAGIDQNLCGTSTSLQGSTIPTGGSGVWALVSGSVIISDATSNTSAISSVAQGNNYLTWTVTAGGCKAVDTVNIINNQLYVDAGNDITICGDEITLKGSALPANSSGVWNVKSGKAYFSNSSLPNSKAYDFGYGDNKLYWIVTKKGCSSTDSITITNYQPSTPDAGSDQNICLDNTTLLATQPVYGTGKWSVLSGSVTFADLNSRSTKITNIALGKNSLVWTITNQMCTLSDTVVITNNETIVDAGHDMTLCDNRTTLEASEPPTGGTGMWSVYKGSAAFLDGTSYNTKVSGFVNGSNILVWSIAKGSCVNSDTVEYICNVPTTANAGPDQFIAADSTTLVGNQPSVGSGKWSVMSGAANFANDTLYNTSVTGLNPGTNTLRWTITNKGCSLYDDVVITNGSIETVDAGQDQVICNNYTQLEAAKPQYGFGTWTVQKGAAIFEDNEAYNSNVTNLANGVNILRWSVIVSGIEYYDTVFITNNTPTTAVCGPHQILCDDSSQLVANVPVRGTGKWTLEGGSALIDNFTSYNSKVTQLGSGDNTFRWTITNGTCTSSATLIITNDIPTQSYAGTDQTVCDNTTELIPNTPFIGTGEWSVVSGAGSFSGNTVTGLAPGTNTLKWTIRNNYCTSSDNVVIISHKPTTANAGTDVVICIDSLNLSANKANAGQGEISYWSVMNGSAIIADTGIYNTKATKLAQGVNVLRWTIDNHGCISYDDVEVNYAFVQSVAGEDIISCSSTVTLNANNPTLGTGEWSVIGGSGTAVFVSSNSPNTIVKNLDQGKNILRWTIHNLTCISKSDVNVTNNAPSTAYAGGDQSLCVNTTTLAARQPLVGTGVWSVLSGSGAFTDTTLFNTTVSNVGVGTNTYRWTVRNADCESTDEVSVSNNKPINTFAGTDQLLCVDSASLSANYPVVGNGSWSIVKGSGIFTDAYTAVTSVYTLSPDTNVLRWTVTNKQCIEYKEIKIINNAPTAALAGADKIICSDSYTMDGNIPTQGIGTWSVLSGSATFINANLYNSLAQGLMLGKNYLRWTIAKEECTSSDDVIITNDLPTQPDAGTTISICSDNTNLNANKPTIGTGYWSLLSGSGTFADSTKYNTSISGLGQGSNMLLWTIKHNNCSLGDVVEVKNNITTVYAGPDKVVFVDSVRLTGNDPSRGYGTWSLEAGAGTIATPNNYVTSVNGLADGVNSFAWSVNIDGCISTDRVQVTYYILPTSMFAVDYASGCPPLTVNFTKTSTDKYSYQWNFGENDSLSTVQNPQYIYKYPGKYTASLTTYGPEGKNVTKTQTIEVFDLPEIKYDLVPPEVYLPDGELRCFNYTSGAVSYLWSFGDGGFSQEFNPSYSYSDTGVYSVSLIAFTSNNCSDTLTKENAVHVIQSSLMKFPSGFTPNMDAPGDGHYNMYDYSNDVFYPIVVMGGIENYKMEIFNRWGVQIFESDDINIGWNGYYKDKLLPEAVYVYKVTGTNNSGKKFSIVGDVLLMHK